VTDPVALFIDLENVATSLWNIHHQTPDLYAWMEKVRGYGPIAFGRAYGDFSQQALAALEADLRNLGIDKFDCPVKQNGQSTVDGNIIIDLYEVALDYPAVRTFILMAGDSDYVRVVAKLRQRLDKQIVVMGVPGSVSRDLVRAAGREDPLEIAAAPEVDDARLIRLIDDYERSRRPGTLPVFRFLKEYVCHPKNADLIKPQFVESKLSEYVASGILVQRLVELEDGRTVKTTQLDRANPTVAQALDWR